MADRSGAETATTRQARNVEVVRRYLRTFVTKGLAELAEDRVVVSLAQRYRRDATGATTVQRACKMYRQAGGRVVQPWGEQDTYGPLRGRGLPPDEPITSCGALSMARCTAR